MRSTEWLAGLLEGEGCFASAASGSTGLYRTPLVSVAMTDGDVIEEVGKVFFCMGGRQMKIGRRALPSKKIAYIIFVTGLPAAKIMTSVLPYMGDRRSAKIKSILYAWEPKKYKDAVLFKQDLLREEHGFKQS